MFRIRDGALTPHLATFQRAVVQLPMAHQAAQQEGVEHIHAHVVEVAEREGIPTHTIGVFGGHQAPYVGIAHGADGDRVADREFGTHAQAPEPVLRSAARAAHPSARARYALRLVEGLL